MPGVSIRPTTFAMCDLGVNQRMFKEAITIRGNAMCRMYCWIPLCIVLTIVLGEHPALGQEGPGKRPARRAPMDMREGYFRACTLWGKDFDRQKADALLSEMAEALKKKIVEDKHSDIVRVMADTVMTTLNAALKEKTSSYSLSHIARQRSIGVRGLGMICLLLAHDLKLPITPGMSHVSCVLTVNGADGNATHYFLVAGKKKGLLLVRQPDLKVNEEDALYVGRRSRNEYLAETIMWTISSNDVETLTLPISSNVDEERVKRYLNLARELAPKSARVPLYAANIMHFGGKFDTVRTLYLEALEKGDRSASTYMNLGSLELSRQGGQPKTSIQYLRKALDRGDTSGMCYELLARALDKNGEADEAFRTVESGLKKNPDDSDLLCLAGFHYMKEKNPKAAFAAFMKALRTSSFDERLYRGVSIALEETSELERKDVLLLYGWILRMTCDELGSVSLWRTMAKAQAWLGEMDSAALSLRNAAAVHGADLPEWYKRDLASLRKMAERAHRTIRPISR